MCGICGKLAFDRHEPADRVLLRSMMRLIEHRGPDGEGEYVAPPVMLGHRRLGIIDLAGGAQPMCNEDGTVWVVYNGEIYNFRELRHELEAAGHAFRSASDTEVIVHLYEVFGDDCVSRLRGMFAFALWDVRRQRLLLARDRVGVKPLYYAATETSLVFASELKSILADPEVSREVNVGAIDTFLTYYFIPGSETLFTGIRKLEPGHYLTVENGRLSIRQYWDLHFGAPSPAPRFDDAVEALRELLSRTVADHMISDVPVGVLLSGGVDSTGVLCNAAAVADRPLQTFTIGFEGTAFADERPFARLAAQRFGTIHHEATMTPTAFRDLLPLYVWHMEEPVCEPPAIALYVLSRMAREASVKVLLSGEGGDEAFGGYQTYRNLLLLERLKQGFGAARPLLRAGLRTLGIVGGRRFAQYADLVAPPLRDHYLSRTSTPYSGFNRRKEGLYSGEIATMGHGPSAGRATHALFERVKGQPLLDQMLYVDTKSWLPDDLLVKADKMTMATSVELRVPLLDYRVLEFAATLPQDYKVRGWTLKRILKAALAPSVPREILERPKTGFPVPYERWLRDEMKAFVFDTLLAADAAIGRYFAPRTVRELLDAHQRGEGVSKEVFSLLVLELWHRHFVGAPAMQRAA